MQIEIHHLLESDDNEIRYNASEDLRDNLQNFGTLVRVFTLAIGGGDDEGGDDVDDVTKGLENLDISAEGAMKQLNVIVSVIGSLLKTTSAWMNVAQTRFSCSRLRILWRDLRTSSRLFT
jgi:hypothetical protein